MLLELDYYKENEDEYSARRVEPYALINGREGWYVAAFDPAKYGVRHFRLDRISRAELTERALRAAPGGQPVGRRRRLAAHRRGHRRRGRAGLDLARAGALGARAAHASSGSWHDGVVAVELSFAGVDWLVREVLKEAGDAAVLEPPDARAAVLAAAKRIG